LARARDIATAAVAKADECVREWALVRAEAARAAKANDPKRYAKAIARLKAIRETLAQAEEARAKALADVCGTLEGR
jgi:hypothetical protein